MTLYSQDNWLPKITGRNSRTRHDFFQHPGAHEFVTRLHAEPAAFSRSPRPSKPAQTIHFKPAATASQILPLNYCNLVVHRPGMHQSALSILGSLAPRHLTTSRPPAGFQNAMPPGIYRFERCQDSLAFRFGERRRHLRDPSRWHEGLKRIVLLSNTPISCRVRRNI
jgi:hypothetical protein